MQVLSTLNFDILIFIYGCVRSLKIVCFRGKILSQTVGNIQGSKRNLMKPVLKVHVYFYLHFSDSREIVPTH